MTITLSADHTHRLLFVRAQGPITLAEIIAHIEEERTVVMVEDVCAIRPFRRRDEAEEWLVSFPMP